MCNALSPEKAVIWSVVRSADDWRAIRDTVKPEHFTHGPYRLAYRLAGALHAGGWTVNEATLADSADMEGLAFDPVELRALRRMVRVAPPERVRTNLTRLAEALVDRAAGRPVHIESLIN